MYALYRKFSEDNTNHMFQVTLNPREGESCSASQAETRRVGQVRLPLLPHSLEQRRNRPTTATQCSITGRPKAWGERSSQRRGITRPVLNTRSWCGSCRLGAPESSPPWTGVTSASGCFTPRAAGPPADGCFGTPGRRRCGRAVTMETGRDCRCRCLCCFLSL